MRVSLILFLLLVSLPALAAERLLVYGFVNQDTRAGQPWPSGLTGFDAVLCIMHPRECWPEPDRYDFSWLDEQAEKAEAAGVKLVVQMTPQGNDEWLVFYPEWWKARYGHLDFDSGIMWGWWHPRMKAEYSAFVQAWAAHCEGLAPTVIAIRASVAKWAEPLTYPPRADAKGLDYNTKDWMAYVETCYDAARAGAPNLDILAPVQSPEPKGGRDWMAWLLTIEAAADRGFHLGLNAIVEEHDTHEGWFASAWWNEGTWHHEPEDATVMYAVELAAARGLGLCWEEPRNEVNSVGELWSNWRWCDKLARWDGRENASTYYVCRAIDPPWRQHVLPYWAKWGRNWKKINR